MDWSWVKNAVCISLVDREDRRVSVTTEFHRVGLCRKVIFYRPKKDVSKIPKPSQRGCWESHRKVGTVGLKRGVEEVLIMEDDVVFSADITPETLAACAEAYRIACTEYNARTFFLGHWPFVSIPTSKPNLKRVFSACAHAYIARKEHLEWLRDNPYDEKLLTKVTRGVGIDFYYAVHPRMFAFHPMLAFQSGSPTSNPKPGIFAKVFDKALSDPKYMRGAETVANVGVPIAMFSIVFALLVAVIAISVRVSSR
jgi:hypothetical protein